MNEKVFIVDPRIWEEATIRNKLYGNFLGYSYFYKKPLQHDIPQQELLFSMIRNCELIEWKGFQYRFDILKSDKKDYDTLVFSKEMII